MSTTQPSIILEEVFELCPEPPPADKYLRTEQLAEFIMMDGTRRVGQRYVGRSKGNTPVWALLPVYNVSNLDQPPKPKGMIQVIKNWLRTKFKSK